MAYDKGVGKGSIAAFEFKDIGTIGKGCHVEEATGGVRDDWVVVDGKCGIWWGDGADDKGLVAVVEGGATGWVGDSDLWGGSEKAGR